MKGRHKITTDVNSKRPKSIAYINVHFAKSGKFEYVCSGVISFPKAGPTFATALKDEDKLVIRSSPEKLSKTVLPIHVKKKKVKKT